MIIGLLKEKEGENRVSLLPDAVATLIKVKAEVWLEDEAGGRAFGLNNDYIQAGAQLKTRDEILSHADVLLSIQNFAAAEISKMQNAAVIIGVYQPLYNYAVMKLLAEKNITS